jgi:aryl-alcohol dehydrogenase-like predicted oxidoreductase
MAGPNLGGTFSIGGDLVINRLGFGAMRLTGPGIWGPPADVEECKRVLARARELGINFIDTADSYGPYVSEELLGQMRGDRGVIATKAGLVRHGPDIWMPVGRPEYLKQEALLSMRRLRVERIDLWQLHRIDPKVPRDEQFDIMRDMQRDGLIKHLGLSEVTVPEIEAASKYFKVVTVQNRYNLSDRTSEEVLAYCETKNIGFIPWFPLAAGELTQPGGAVDVVAKQRGALASQVAIAWLLQRSPVMLPIPGTSKVNHLEENAKSGELTLTDDEFRMLDGEGRKVWERQTHAVAAG